MLGRCCAGLLREEMPASVLRRWALQPGGSALGRRNTRGTKFAFSPLQPEDRQKESVLQIMHELENSLQHIGSNDHLLGGSAV